MTICYVHLGNNNSADRVLIRGLRENGVTVTEISDNSPGLRKFFKIFTAFKKVQVDSPCDSIIVGYTATIFVPWMKLLTRKPVTYYALCSFYESMIISRRVGGKLSFQAFKYWILDYLAFHSAQVVLVESGAQKEFISKNFGVRGKKLVVHRTGVDEKIFYFDPSIQKLERFTVVFRGKFTPEAGVEILLDAAKKLEEKGVKDIHFRILGHGVLQKDILAYAEKLKITNLEINTEYLPDEDLRRKILQCHLSLGQLSDHPRLNNTLPFKSFEALSMKIPFLTARNRGIMEVFKEGETCLSFNPGDADDLAQKILFAYENPALLERLSVNGYTLFTSEFTAQKLAYKILEKLPH